MKFLAGLMASVSMVVCGAAVGVAGQQTVRAVLVTPKDRPPVTPFQLPDASGRVVRPSDFPGKPLVVNLWATACTGCRAELPAFVELARAYRSRGLTVIGVSLDVMYSDLKSVGDGWALVKPFVATHQMRYPIVVDDGSVEKGFNVTALPATYLVDRHGRVAATYIGVVDQGDLEDNVKVLLDERR